MPVDKTYFIHSRGGEIGAQGLTTTADIDAIVSAVKATPERHLIVHFHGGLVSEAAGFATAEALLPVYLSGGHPLFFLWESGAWETIRNNIAELADEPVFKQLVRKLLEYALKRLGGTDGARSIAPGKVDPKAVKATIDNFVANPSKDTVPYKNFVPVVPSAVARSAADTVDEAEIQADLETDPEFLAALATLPDVPPGLRSSLSTATVLVRDSPFARTASEKFSKSPDRRGLIAMYKVAVVVKNILVGILRRYHKGRDHRLYATVVEEIIRSFKLGGSGLNEWGKALQWNRMKKDCEDAFGGDPKLHAGTALLTSIKEGMNGGKDLKRVTLIGHSTGGVYICNFLEAADKILSADVVFDVVLLAPAVTYSRFSRMLSSHSHRIKGIRMFAMCDELEREDQVLGDHKELAGEKDWRRFIYPSSLLYLVSGILESKDGPNGEIIDEADMPLLGMQRYFSESSIYTEESFPEVESAREWFNTNAHTLVWSYSDAVGDGLNCHCNDHSAFNHDPAMLASLTYIVTSGF